MARLFATAGTKLYIGAAKSFNGTDFTETDFTTGSPTWTEVKGTTDLGSSGDSAQLISSEHVGSSRTRKIKGTRNAGSMTVVCDLDLSDAGQLALVAAEKTNDSYAFRLEFDDAPDGGTPSYRYFVAYVLSASENLGGANSVKQLNAQLEIDSNIVRVAAAEAP